MKNLEWTAAMVEYTRVSDVIGARPKAFMEWVMNRKETYPNLTAFLIERAPRLQTA
jgi:hypothetical protein